MPVDYAYPPQLGQFLRQEWEASEHAPPLLDQDRLERVLTVAYQASLMREEDRPVRLRLVVADPDEFDPLDGPPFGLQPLVFEQPVRFAPDEVRRLALAAKYHRALIGVRAEGTEGRLVAWGMLQSGPGWIQVAQGGRGPAPGPPASALVVRVLGPGHLAVGRGTTTLAELRAGIVGAPGMDVFRSAWLPSRFLTTRAELSALHAEARATGEAEGERWTDLEPEVMRLLSQAMVRRFIAAMVSAHHGGTVVIVPPGEDERILNEHGPLRLKYAFRDAPPRKRYRSLILTLMSRIARAGAAAGLARVDAAAYASLRDPELAALKDAIFEMSQLIAALTEVDGAVVMTKRFEVLGFGAEIAGDLPDLKHVARAIDLEAVDTVLEPLVADGTRHRSAYRLCSAMPEALAIVVSHDGSVRFVATHAGQVTFWEHHVEGVDE
jgi:hypothetical protein